MSSLNSQQVISSLFIAPEFAKMWLENPDDTLSNLYGEKSDVFSLGLTLLLDYLSLPQKVLPNPFYGTEEKRKEEIGKLLQMVDDD